jgi:adhesin HecA-like repeat protein
MAAHDWRTGTYAIDPQGRGNFNGQQEFLKGQKFTIVRYFDASAVNMTGDDTFKVMTIDAGVLVTNVQVLITTYEAGTLTLDIGDSAGGTTFASAININQQGVLIAADDLTYKYYAAADYIVIEPNNTADATKFYLIVEGIRLV